MWWQNIFFVTYSIKSRRRLQSYKEAVVVQKYEKYLSENYYIKRYFMLALINSIPQNKRLLFENQHIYVYLKCTSTNHCKVQTWILDKLPTSNKYFFCCYKGNIQIFACNKNNYFKLEQLFFFNYTNSSHTTTF